MSCTWAEHDGAYVLGSLPPGERHAYEAHLPGCAACTDAVRELAGLPGLLARVDADLLLDEGLPPVPDVLPALQRRARLQARRRVVLTSLAAAAAAAVLGGSVVASGILGGGGAGVAAPPSTTATTAPAGQAMTRVDTDAVSAELALVPVAWGTRLDLTCSYEVPATVGHRPYDEEGPAYALVVQTRTGRTEQVATWHALPGRTMRLTGATATARADIGEVQVRSAAGRVVLRLPVAG